MVTDQSIDKARSGPSKGGLPFALFLKRFNSPRRVRASGVYEVLSLSSQVGQGRVFSPRLRANYLPRSEGPSQEPCQTFFKKAVDGRENRLIILDMNSAAFEIQVNENGVWVNHSEASTPREAAEQKEWAARDLKVQVRVWSNRLGKEMSF